MKKRLNLLTQKIDQSEKIRPCWLAFSAWDLLSGVVTWVSKGYSGTYVHTWHKSKLSSQFVYFSGGMLKKKSRNFLYLLKVHSVSKFLVFLPWIVAGAYLNAGGGAVFWLQDPLNLLLLDPNGVKSFSFCPCEKMVSSKKS